MTTYDHKKIESKWQAKWEKNKLYVSNIAEAKQPFYNLWMFPYPSAEGLHVGTIFAATGSDIYGRFMRMQGKDVFQPIGYDSFGIHGENFALKIGKSPQEVMQKTLPNYQRQLKDIGHGYDWTRTVTTSDIDYYKWTQWLFVQLFKAGLAYKKKAAVNWCPSCKTVLADEQIFTPAAAGKWPKQYTKLEDVPEGIRVCERCGSEPKRKELEQWFFRITEYADRLLSGLDKINWSQRVVTAQKEWIGLSKGLEINFRVDNSHLEISVWTKFWETVFGTTFLVLAPDHSVLQNFEIPNTHKKEIAEYVKKSLNKSEQQRKEEAGEKTGVFTGLYAINPMNKDKIPIWIADYVLVGVGTGAVMGVPAHDQRDFEFAKKYHLDIVPVVVPEREYVDEKAKNYYHRRSQLHHDLLVTLAKDAHKAQKKLMVTGGWAVFLQTGSEFRDFEDLDLVILDSELEWWKEKFSSLGFEMSNMFPEGKNPKYYFQATKKDIHVDILAIRINEKGKVIWLDSVVPKESDGFENIFEEKNIDNDVVYVMNKNILYYIKNKQSIRWKEKADFLFMGYNSYEGPGRLVNSGQFNDFQAWGEGKEKIASWLIDKKVANWKTTYHLRDWLISRQRYWGPPIPMIYCGACAARGECWFSKNKNSCPADWNSTGWYPEESLPVELPIITDYQPGGHGKGPLANHPEFYKTTCPHCGGEATRETDVSDTFVDSSWYFLRYPSVGSSKADKLAFDPEITRKWLPVSLYFGGAEHAVLHLMYARFVTMVLYDLKLINFEEPFPKFFAHGLLIKDGAKMSKSRGNVVNPDEYIAKYGADTLRLYLMFMGPMDGSPDFRDSGIEGMSRFIDRVWQLSDNQRPATNPGLVNKALHTTIQKVTLDIQQFKYNTAISAIMEFVNVLRDLGTTPETINSLILLIAPFTPHLAEEMWFKLGHSTSVHLELWPKFDEGLLKGDKVIVVVQVNGKLRERLEVESRRAGEQEYICQLALASAKVKNYLKGLKYRIIFVPDKLINYVGPS